MYKTTEPVKTRTRQPLLKLLGSHLPFTHLRTPSVKKGRYVQGTPYDPTQNYAPLTIPFETDTNHPRSIVPIYFVHTPEQPFCANTLCSCHRNQAHIALLVAAIQQGEMTLREAADFADGKGL